MSFLHALRMIIDPSVYTQVYIYIITVCTDGVTAYMYDACMSNMLLVKNVLIMLCIYMLIWQCNE